MVRFNNESFRDLILELAPALNTESRDPILNIPAAFDTEFTSFYDESDCEESALCYIWMFGINDTVVYGRELDEFVDLIHQLNGYLVPSRKRLLVYVHFLKADFSYIKKLFDYDQVFITGSRDPLYARYGAIEFRDSLVLAGGKSLAFVGNHLRNPVQKAVGDLDYDLIRHPQTPLTDKELHYCEQDIRVLIQYIREKMEDEGGKLSKVPYTNTGYVRRDVRNATINGPKKYEYITLMDQLTITPDAYLQSELAFQGGAVGPNIMRIGEVDERGEFTNTKTWENVHSYDIKSSYPYVMCTRYFPMSYPTPIPDRELRKAESRDSLLNNYCCLFTLEVWDLVPLTNYAFPISYHKLQNSIGVRKASGRVMSAAYIEIVCTELDYAVWTKFYDITPLNSRITHLRIFNRGYLPEPIVRQTLSYFNKKTTLDGIAGKEEEYMLSKNMLNSIYGMMVERPVRPIYHYDIEHDFTHDAADYMQQIADYNENPRRFLYYPWGVYVTAWARYRLYEGIYAVGDNFLYCDTDSVKYTGSRDPFFEEENKRVHAEMVELSKRLKLPLDYIMPSTPEGIQMCLGVWEHEWDAHKFKTIGAKRYLVDYAWTAKGNRKYEQGTKLELTVAGSNKSGTLEYILKKAKAESRDPFDVFDAGLVVPPEYAKRTISKFIDNERNGWVTDYLGNRYYYDSLSGLHIKPASYSFSITEEMYNAVISITHDAVFGNEDL